MKIYISKTKKLSEIQDDFSKLFNLLKLEFYKNPHKEMEGNLKNEQLNKDININELNSRLKEFDWEINPKKSVQEFENEFSQIFGFHVQVFRKNKNVWLQTTNSDTWTLEEQQKHAEELTTSLDENEELDYHEQE